MYYFVNKSKARVSVGLKKSAKKKLTPRRPILGEGNVGFMDLDINRIQSDLPRRLLDLNLNLHRSLKGESPTKLELIE